MVTLIATPEPNATPPRVRLELATGVAGQTFTSITVRRNGVQLREQPYAGGETALGYDYEAPFGVPLEYTAEVTYSSWSTRRNETWPNLTGWTTSGSPSVSAGQLVLPQNSSASRALDYTAPARLTINDPSTWGGAAFLRYGYLSLHRSGGDLYFNYGGRGMFLPAPIAPSSPAMFTWAPGQMTATWGENTRALPQGTSAPYFNGLQISSTQSGTRHVGSFLIEGVDGAQTTSTISSSTQLDVDAAWLTHIVAPALSMPIAYGGSDDRLFLEHGSGWSRVSKSQRNIHYPIGRSNPIIVTSGPRTQYEFSINVQASTLALRGALESMLADQTPLLLRSPTGFDWDVADGWYSVGDVNTERKVPASSHQGSTVTLPLTPVDPPVLPQGSTRTLSDVALEAADLGGVDDKYVGLTLQDLQVGV